MTAPAAVIEISKLSTRFGKHVVHSELDLEVRRETPFDFPRLTGQTVEKRTLPPARFPFKTIKQEQAAGTR